MSSPEIIRRLAILDTVTLNDLYYQCKSAAARAWGKTSHRMRLLGAYLGAITVTIWLSTPILKTVEVPQLSLEYQYQRQASKFNESKVALLIENRPNPILAPLMLHMMSVVPPDWRFRFMGSLESVASINRSVAIREQVRAGKLDLTYIPANMTTGSQEEISRFLTNLWLHEVVLQPAEWLLVFQTDSILCANSRHSLNEFLDYDWVGAPWNPGSRFGGNGGLSLRRVSAIVEVLKHQLRQDGSEPEDVWLTDRLGHRPGAKLANGTISLLFSGESLTGDHTKVEKGKQAQDDGAGVKPVSDSRGIDTIEFGAAVAANEAAAKLKQAEQAKHRLNETLSAAEKGYIEGIDDWRDGFYEPMGYHTGGSGHMLHSGIWGRPELRKHIWDYCPEVKMTLAMDAARYVPGNCGSRWKRNGEGGWGWEEPQEGDEGMFDLGATDMGYGTESIGGKEYPMLPPGLVPW